ncbi:MAG: hypothetical protein ABI611_17600 [Solirubrobacteraceae bacterium]
MATDRLPRRRARHVALTLGAILALLGLNATPGLASASEERQGAQLLQSVQAGKQDCQQLSRDQFELIGEYVMGRMVGSTARHEAMNRQITATSGASGEVQAHVFMGQRFAGCATGAAPAAFGSMMGMMGNYSGANGGMTGSGHDGGNGSGSNMMGGSGSRAGGDNGSSATNTALIILVAVLAVALAALAARRPWRRSPPKTPLDVLRDSYARGDLDTADYEQRRHALEGRGT